MFPHAGGCGTRTPRGFTMCTGTPVHIVILQKYMHARKAIQEMDNDTTKLYNRRREAFALGSLNDYLYHTGQRDLSSDEDTPLTGLLGNFKKENTEWCEITSSDSENSSRSSERIRSRQPYLLLQGGQGPIRKRYTNAKRSKCAVTRFNSGNTKWPNHAQYCRKLFGNVCEISSGSEISSANNSDFE